MYKSILALILCLFLTLNVVFTSASAEGQVVTSSETRSNVAKIIYAGLGGAVIGLSTLSFYGRPQDHMGNVAVGFAAGIIGGAIYVTYSTVQFKSGEARELQLAEQLNKGRFSSSDKQIIVGIEF